ncbi:DgyrCDS121 [Dimorphilus gyrociliatus]|uniref:DgyrCDS121 n=1 Tax=Dimorphilus gyrociliatus TaxID=2664684 RepID=A0A7I8V3V8_9ANNE|nr:DgyrCDS121 [Dimorphilus gyrociliatus]
MVSIKYLLFSLLFFQTYPEVRTTCTADIGLIIDSSGSIKLPNWIIIKNFAKNLIRRFHVEGKDGTKFAAATFATKAHQIFNLNSFQHESEYIKSIDGMKYHKTRTNTTGGLKLMLNEQFTIKNGNRPHVDDVFILITDGKPTENETLLQDVVEKIHKAGIHFVAVGVTEEIDEELLRRIVRDPDCKLHPKNEYCLLPENPYKNFFIYVKEFNQLTGVIDRILNSSCKNVEKTTISPFIETTETILETLSTEPQITTIPSGETTAAMLDKQSTLSTEPQIATTPLIETTETMLDKRSTLLTEPQMTTERINGFVCPMDIGLIIDNSNSIKHANTLLIDNWKIIKSFLKDLIYKFHVSNKDKDSVRFAANKFGNSSQTIFQLNSYQTKQDYANAIDNIEFIGGFTNIAGGLSKMLTEQFKEDLGNRRNADDVFILITDGKPNIDVRKIPHVVEMIHKANIRLIAIGISKNVNETQLREYVKDPDCSITKHSKYCPSWKNPYRNSYFKVNEFNKLSTIINELIASACFPRATFTPSIFFELSSTNLDTMTTATREPHHWPFKSELCLADIGLIIDNFPSINEVEEQKMKEFLIELISNFYVTGDRGTRFAANGIATTNNQATFQLNSYKTINEYNLAINHLNFTNSNENLTVFDSLNIMFNQQFTAKNGNREQVKDVYMIITNGNFIPNTQMIPNILKKIYNTTVQLIGIGIKDSIKGNLLREYVRDPDCNLYPKHFYCQSSKNIYEYSYFYLGISNEMRHVRDPLTGRCVVCDKGGAMHPHHSSPPSKWNQARKVIYVNGMRPNTSPNSSPTPSVRYVRDGSPRREPPPKPDVIYVNRESRPRSAPRDVTIVHKEPRSKSLPRETTFYNDRPPHQQRPDVTYVHRDRSPSPRLRTIVHRATDNASDISARSRPSVVRETHIHERPRSGSTVISKPSSTGFFKHRYSKTIRHRDESPEPGCCGGSSSKSRGRTVVHKHGRSGRNGDVEHVYHHRNGKVDPNYSRTTEHHYRGERTTSKSYHSRGGAPDSSCGRRQCCAVLLTLLFLLALAGLALGLYFGIKSAKDKAERNDPANRYPGGYYVDGVYVYPVTRRPSRPYFVLGKDQPCNPFNNGTDATTAVPNCAETTTRVVLANFTLEPLPSFRPVYLASGNRISPLSVLFVTNFGLFLLLAVKSPLNRY